MVLDRIEKLGLYLSADKMEKLRPVLSRLNENSEEGKYEVDGDNIFIKVLSYDTKADLAECRNEAHNAYIDIQVTLAGVEGIGVFERSALTPCDDYNEQKDVIHYTVTGAAMIADLCVAPGYFALLYPHEAHRPKETIDPKRTHIKKFVIKIKL